MEGADELEHRRGLVDGQRLAPIAEPVTGEVLEHEDELAVLGNLTDVQGAGSWDGILRSDLAEEPGLADIQTHGRGDSPHEGIGRRSLHHDAGRSRPALVAEAHPCELAHETLAHTDDLDLEVGDCAAVVDRSARPQHLGEIGGRQSVEERRSRWSAREEGHVPSLPVTERCPTTPSPLSPRMEPVSLRPWTSTFLARTTRGAPPSGP